jgi:hypothetical protein
LLNNPALHIRRSVAAGLYQEVVDPEFNVLHLENDRLEDCYSAQQTAFESAAMLHKQVTERYASVMEELRPLEILLVDSHEVHARQEVLNQDVEWQVMQCREELVADYNIADPEEAREEHDRITARSVMMLLASFLLACDPGLSLERARKILAFLVAKVVRYDPAWQFHNLRDDDVRRDRQNWYLRDLARARLVELNVVEADDAQLEALRERDEAKCAICLETFDDHKAAPGFDRPVQNRLCAKRGCDHWCARACFGEVRAHPTGPQSDRP